MSVGSKKEMRLLGGAWAAAIVLSLTPALVPVDAGLGALWILPFALGCAVLANASFGSELERATINWVLPQPRERSAVWRAKARMLGVALGSAALGYVVALAVRSLFLDDGPGLVLWLAAAVVPACTLGGGLWASLRLKGESAAVWITLLLPGLIVLLLGPLLAVLLPSTVALVVLLMLLAAYSIGTYLSARALWLGFESDLGGGWDQAITARIRGLRRPRLPGIAVGRRFRIGALVAKEITLQQINLAIAFGLLLLMGVVAMVTVISPSIDELIGLFLRLLWYLLPVFIGAVAISSERQFGVLEWQQVLPISRRLQFWLKTGSVLVLGLFVGGVVPWLLDTYSNDFSVFQLLARSDSWGLYHNPFQWLTLYAIIPLLALQLGLFGSSLACNLLQSLSVAFIGAVLLLGMFFGGAIAIVFAIDQAVPYHTSYFEDVRPLLVGLGALALLVVLGILVARNYRAIRIDRRACLVNGGGVILTVAVVFAITAFLYFRTWEVIGFGPPPAKMGFKGDIDPKVTVQYRSATMLTPNGEIFRWGTWYGTENGGPAMHHRRGPRDNDPKPFGGTNWVDMAANRYCALAVRRDGSLWGAGWNRRGHLGTDGTVEWGAKPIAKGRAWSTVAVGWTHAVAVSREGALYGWGENDPDGDDPDKIGHLGLKGVERVGEPRQLGSRSDWMDVTASYGLTKEGQIWGWRRSSRSMKTETVNDEGFHATRLLQRDGLVELIDSERGVTVKDENENWWFFASEWPESAEAPKRNLIRVPGDWRYVMGSDDRGLGIKADGTLWHWRSGDTVSDATQIGRRSDWIAVHMGRYSYCGLTSDATAWLWGRPLDGGHGRPRLIPYPWRPQPKGVVLSETTR